MDISSLKKWTWVLIAILGVLSIQPLSLSAWRFADETLQTEGLAQLERSGHLQEPILSADLNGDGKMECLVLTGQRLSITDCGSRSLWQSPDAWQVKEAQIGDLNRDGKAEVDLLVWRPFKPWPIDTFLPAGGRISTFHNQAGLSCHVILIGWTRGGYNELWAGSALIRPVSQLSAVDLDGDGWQELAALEGQYDQHQTGGDLTVWRWNGFGFTLAAQEKGDFRQLQIIGTQASEWLVVQK
jgi:hypothetical protein